jgi:acetate---CoA ligase (ADP-forming)
MRTEEAAVAGHELPVSGRAPLDRLLRPRSVAIVGASPNPSSFGASVLANLENAGFTGEIHLINPKRSEIHGRPCLPSLDDLPMGVDCVVLAIPRASVLESVTACGRRRVGGLIIFSAGFAESGAEGRTEQENLATIARENGMILEGPNCLGMVNFVDGVPLTFVLTPPARHAGTDGIAVASQSGALAAVVVVGLRHRQLGISFSISTGNEAASNVEDYVEYLVDEEHTRVILMIVEHFRRPKKFLAAAARARSVGKHIVLLHPGRSGAARASAETHTGAMARDYEVMRTKVSHAGVVVVDTLEELLDVSEILVRCPDLPSGGAAVFTESGAFKALTLDFCDMLGLPLPTLGEETAAALRGVMPDFIPPTNPLDLTAQALVDPGLYGRTLPIIINDNRFGSLVLGIILTDEATSGLKFPPIIEAVRRIKPSKPVLFAGLDEGAQVSSNFVRELRSLGVPFFPSPERAYRALARLTAFAEQQALHKISRPGFELEAGELPSLLTRVIPEYRSKEILRSRGIRVPEGGLGRTVKEAQSIAAEIGYPVVLKAQSADLSHKSDVGGVALNLSTPESVAIAWERMHEEIARTRPGLALDGILVERMGGSGVELIVGAQSDPEWGPVLLVGFGGVLAEALRDSRLLPPELSVEAIECELFQLKSAALLRGFRGSPALDVRAAAEIVHRLASLMLATPQIRELDINPVIVYPRGHGAVALDALIVTQ